MKILNIISCSQFNLHFRRFFGAILFTERGKIISGLPDGIFSNQFGKFWWDSEWKKPVHFMPNRNTLRTSGIFYGHLVIYIVAIWRIFLHFGILCKEKSGNPDWNFVVPFCSFMALRVLSAAVNEATATSK
jgi:hypothetical protein